jgi:hypothetical protein
MDESLQCIERERTFFDIYKITKNKVFFKNEKEWKKNPKNYTTKLPT